MLKTVLLAANEFPIILWLKHWSKYDSVAYGFRVIPNFTGDWKPVHTYVTTTHTFVWGKEMFWQIQIIIF